MNFEATEINHLCSPEDSTEPPITMKLSREEIQSYDTHSFEYNVPSHTHSVERNVKLTMTECAGAVAGAQKRYCCKKSDTINLHFFIIILLNYCKQNSRGDMWKST